MAERRAPGAQRGANRRLPPRDFGLPKRYASGAALAGAEARGRLKREVFGGGQAVEQPFGRTGAGREVEAAGEDVDNMTALGVEALQVVGNGGDWQLGCQVGVRNGQVFDELAVSREIVAAEKAWRHDGR